MDRPRPSDTNLGESLHVDSIRKKYLLQPIVQLCGKLFNNFAHAQAVSSRPTCGGLVKEAKLGLGLGF